MKKKQISEAMSYVASAWTIMITLLYIVASINAEEAGIGISQSEATMILFGTYLAGIVQGAFYVITPIVLILLVLSTIED